MSYWHYFYSVRRDEVEKIKDMTPLQLMEYIKQTHPNEDWVPFDDIAEQKKVYEFGELWDDTSDRIYASGTPLFSKSETMEEYSEYQPFSVGKEGLLTAIQIYKEKIIQMYKGLLQDDNANEIDPLSDRKTAQEKQLKHCARRLREWQSGFILDLREKSLCVSESWLYEFAIFNLVNLLKTVDWESETLLFYGH